MNIDSYRCINCFRKSFLNLIQKAQLSENEQQQFVVQMNKVLDEYANYSSAPEISRALHKILQSYTNNPDPYKEVKKMSNDLVLGMYPTLKTQVLHSSNPFDTALRLAIAGNVIDYAAHDNFNVDETIRNVFTASLAINHSIDLKVAISKAKSILYLGDNTGEIVFDKLFIETIMHPNLIYAVRGGAIINDATLEDAKYVGMDVAADVISNGYDAPSTILDACSDDFQRIFNEADLIISKGQGNFEGLMNQSKKNIFFLLMAKCDVIADELNVPKGSFIVKRNSKTMDEIPVRKKVPSLDCFN